MADAGQKRALGPVGAFSFFHGLKLRLLGAFAVGDVHAESVVALQRTAADRTHHMGDLQINPRPVRGGRVMALGNGAFAPCGARDFDRIFGEPLLAENVTHVATDDFQRRLAQ